MATKIITVEATPPSESTGADYNKGAPLNAAEFDQNIVNLRAAVDRKASLNNPTFTGTVTLPSTTSIGDVSATELQYLNSVTSNVQDQINSKAPINNPTFTGTVSLPGGTANGVLYLNGSKVATSGSGLVFDGTNLGIGTASPTNLLHIKKSTASNTFLQVQNSLATTYYGVDATGTAYVWNGSNYPVIFGINDTERMRLDVSGNLLVGTTDGSTGNKLAINGPMAFINGSKIPQINYYSSASTIEYVNRNSGGSKTFSWYYEASGAGSPATLSKSGVWTNASDSRGKENITDIGYGLNTVMEIQARQYDVKSDQSHAIGFIAQELLPIVPEVVHVTRTDESGKDWYGVDYGSISAVLVKAIQEQQAIIESLTQRIEALEYTKQGE